MLVLLLKAKNGLSTTTLAQYKLRGFTFIIHLVSLFVIHDVCSVTLTRGIPSSADPCSTLGGIIRNALVLEIFSGR